MSYRLVGEESSSSVAPHPAAAAPASAPAKSVWPMPEIISHSPVGMAVIDFDGIYRAVNPAYCRLYDYAEQELIGSSFTMVFPHDRRATNLRRHQRFLSVGGDYDGELDVVTRDGTMLSVVSRSVRLPSEDERGLRLVHIVDFTERRRTEAKLRASEEMYRTLFETVPQGIVYHDLHGHITAANPAAERILGLSLSTLLGRSARDPRWQMVREDGTPFRDGDYPYAIAMRTRKPVQNLTMGIMVPDLGMRWISVNAIPLFRDGGLACVYSCFEDITERVNRDLALAQAAATDFLTGVANRRGVMDRLALECARLSRHPDLQCSVLAVDLDLFKRINDSLGHGAGDAVLRQAAALMLAQVRTSDLVGRVGGEEFLVILDATSLGQACALAERLRACVEHTPTQIEGRGVPVTISIGVAAVRAGDLDPARVLERADRALYEAKRTGRNRVCAAD